MLTLNEEYHLPKVLANIMPWAEKVFVVDSYSKDRTVEIAQNIGATVVKREFTNFGDQWNFALKELPIDTEWTMKLDPDERVDEELAESIKQAILSPNPYDGYEVSWRIWFMGKPLHVRQNVLRIWKTGMCRFTDVLVNEHPIVDGTIGLLRGNLEHYDRPSLHEWFEKQNRYTTLEAIMKSRGDALGVTPKLFGSALEHRMYFKKIFFKIPMRYTLLYCYHLFCKGALRDGREGFAWAHLRTEVIRMIDYKTREMMNKGKISKQAQK
jgi:glycosyltransferase involved in cell wall biosynthesis